MSAVEQFVQPLEAAAADPLSREQVAIVIPARNEVRSLWRVAAACLGEARWVIIVDDASDDGTLASVADLPVTAVRSDVHLGKGGALAWGFRIALDLGAAAVVTLDGDGQHDPRDIGQFVAAANRNPGQIILGARRLQRARAPLYRRIANAIADFWISRTAGQSILDSQCGHRLYPRNVLASIRPGSTPKDGFVFESEFLIAAGRRGFRIASVPIEARYPPNARASHFRPTYDIWRITRMVIGKLWRET